MFIMLLNLRIHHKKKKKIHWEHLQEGNVLEGNGIKCVDKLNTN